MNQPQSNIVFIQKINAILNRLEMNWHEPRVVAYIQDLTQITGINYNYSNLPINHCLKLISLLEVYERVYIILRRSDMCWENIEPLLAKYSTKNRLSENSFPRLKLQDWLKLESELALKYCPF